MNHIFLFGCLMYSMVLGALGTDYKLPVINEGQKRQIAEKYFELKKIAPALNSKWESRNEPEQIPELKVTWQNSKARPIVEIDQNIFLVLDAETLEVMVFSVFGEFNRSIFTDRDISQRLPTWEMGKAIRKARDYLESCHFKLPESTELDECVFDHLINDSLWRVAWRRKFAAYMEDDETLGIAADHIRVRLDEIGAFIGYNRLWHNLEPASYEVKIKQEPAIELAAAAVPALQQTPIYRAWRPGGLSVLQFKSAELLVCFPNWWLDPSRAIFHPTEPHKERRLCWVVRLQTGNKGIDANGKKLDNTSSVLVTILIDAATGEVVGAGVL